MFIKTQMIFYLKSGGRLYIKLDKFYILKENHNPSLLNEAQKNQTLYEPALDFPE